MKKDKKSIILSAATKLFNNQSFAAVSLHELAQKIGMTRGNLTYHFKTKDALLLAIAEQMWEKLATERRKSRQLPSFENLHNEVQVLYRIQKEYAFIYLDTHVLNHSAIKKQFRLLTQQAIEDNKATIAFSIKNGNMKPEPFSGIYHNLAFTTWMLSFYWLSQQIIRGEKNKNDVEKIIWSMLVPHFTDKGIKAFKAFFGTAYFNNLGDAFEADQNSLLSF